jgi:Fic-DOC domain mobile mystery protein B
VKLTYPEGATPLDAAALEGLLPAVTTQGELNEFEAANVADATLWATRSRTVRRDLLTASVLKGLHRRMFDRTWSWAGTFRTSGTNIGVPWAEISVDIKNLCDDVAYQETNGVYLSEEMAVRFHHRLVVIHPFPNGNGRHARLAADILMRRRGGKPFGWGSASLVRDGAARKEYLAALKEADGGKLERLISFARS